MSSIGRIGIVGAGTMGHGIAQVAVASGYEVVLADTAPAALERGAAQVAKGLGRLVDKGKLAAEERERALARLATAADLAAFERVDLAIEAVVERLEVKLAVLAELDRRCPPHAILATNTSSISITRLAAATRRPALVIGMHFMNPVPLMQLIEVIRGLATAQETYDAVEAAARRMGKTPVEVHDAPGFVSNRVLMPMINEAIFCLSEGVGKAEAIDQVMKLGMNHPMGPLALADLIGLDVCLDVMRVLQQGFGDPKYRPCPLLVKMVDAGRLGRKSGRGFYDYAETPPAPAAGPGKEAQLK
ncbi:MAG: 3-hydroxybutyryl-CoA dehydrogenase [Acidobacteria bacterium]|nr:3-hydroxybutyryl-CoA dehydrogenase [Acidobacteriota bacterium]